MELGQQTALGYATLPFNAIIISKSSSTCPVFFFYIVINYFGFVLAAIA
jgi:hypothetical protein